MKKYVVIILLSLLIFSSCSAEEKAFAHGYETVRKCNMYSNLNLNGMLYMESCDEVNGESSRLRFIDFDTMQSAVICSKPNCKHNDSGVCSAFGMNVSECFTNIFGDKLYFFETVPEWSYDDSGKAPVLTWNLNLWSADLDGTQRKKIDTFEALEILDLVVKGNTVYFTAREQKKIDSGGATKLLGLPKAYLCAYDFENCVFQNLGKLCEGFEAYAAINGEYNGGLYIAGSYREKEREFYNPDGSEKSLEELAKDNNFTTVRYRFDFEAGALSDWDMPISTLDENDRIKPMFISGGFYGYMDGNNAHIIDSEGNEMILKDYELSTSSADIPVNGYYFNVTGDKGGTSSYTAVELSSGKIFKINKKAVPKWHFVLTYHDGNYIVYDEIGSGDFKKVSPDELMGAEIK